MSSKEKTRKRVTETDTQLPEVPKDFICIDPAQMHLVFDFLKGSRQDIEDMTMTHLRLCLHCREIAATVLKINKYFESKSGHYLHAEKSEIAVEAEQVLCEKTEDDEQELYAPAGEEDAEADFSISNPSL